MLVVLAVSTLAAALVPTDPEPGRTSDETATAPTAAQPRGELLRRAVDARGRPEVVRVQVGDQLQLMVAGDRADQVEIAGFGELREVDPDTPASFDLLPFGPGSHPIRLLGAGRTIGRIVVTPRRAASGKPRRKA